MKSIIIKSKKGELILKLKRTEYGVEVIKSDEIQDVSIKVILHDGQVIDKWSA